MRGWLVSENSKSHSHSPRNPVMLCCPEIRNDRTRTSAINNKKENTPPHPSPEPVIGGENLFSPPMGKEGNIIWIIGGEDNSEFK